MVCVCVCKERKRLKESQKEMIIRNRHTVTIENNSMGKSRDLFKKIRDTKGKLHAKMGTIKGRNAMDLTEAEDIKKRWQEYTEELYKESLMTQMTTMV